MAMEGDWISIMPTLLSLLAAACTVVGFLLYGRRINRQELRLNKFKLKERQEAEDSRKMADVRVTATYLGRGRGVITVSNHGKCEARNVTLQSKCIDCAKPSIVLSPRDKFPCPLIAPGGNVAVKYTLLSLSDKTPLAVVVWDDDYSDGRNSVHSLDLC